MCGFIKKIFYDFCLLVLCSLEIQLIIILRYSNIIRRIFLCAIFAREVMNKGNEDIMEGRNLAWSRFFYSFVIQWMDFG